MELRHFNLLDHMTPAERLIYDSLSPEGQRCARMVTDVLITNTIVSAYLDGHLKGSLNLEPHLEMFKTF